MLTATLGVLTPRQREIYDFVRDSILNRNLPPTVREIGEKFDIKSPNGVCCHLKALEKKGLIKRDANLSRSIRLLEKTPRKTTLVHGGVFDPSGSKLKSNGEVVDFMDILGNGEHTAFEFSGSNVEGTQKGDFVICRKQKFYRDGDTVIATVDGKTYMRSYFMTSGGCRLQDPNKQKPAVDVTESSKFEVHGVVIGLIRKSL